MFKLLRKDELLKNNTNISHVNRGLRSKVGCFDDFNGNDIKENIDLIGSGMVTYSVREVQETQGCRFCIGNQKIYIGNENTCSVDKQNKKLLISHSKKKSKLISVMDINYCPKCGRKIRED